MDDSAPTLKILTVGSSGVGKTALLIRYVDEEFVSSYISTIGVDFRVKQATIPLPNGNSVVSKLQIWDTAGQDRFKTIVRSYYRGADGVLLVFDVSDETSFHQIHHWLKQIHLNAPESIVKLLVGNKNDLTPSSTPPRVISKSQALELAQNFNFEYIETSAQSGENVQKCFEKIAAAILLNRNPSAYESQQEVNINTKNGSDPHSDATSNSNKTCCSN